jgi:hypothetical protein
MKELISDSLTKAAKESIPPVKHHNFNHSLPKYIVQLIKLRKKAKNEANKNYENSKLHNSLTTIVRKKIRNG